MTAPESEPPDQIHLQGIHPPVQFTPPPLPPRKAYKSQDFDQILQFMRPALEHLLQPNTEYLNRQSSQKPLIHPVYAQNIHAIVSNFQSHHKIPQYMDQIEAGHEFFSRIDNYLIQTVENWHTQIIHILSEHTPDPSPADASAIFFLNLYLSAFTYFHHGLATFNYLCSAFNSQFIVLRDASLGGYSWMTYEEQRYIANSNSFEQKSRRIDEILCKWSYEPSYGHGAAERAQAVLCAQAATNGNEPIPILALGHKRWRQHLLNPILSDNLFQPVLDLLKRSNESSPLSVQSTTRQLITAFNRVGLNPFHPIVEALEALLPE